ncbi:LacI family DNA-binding transcriptional regulator [Microbacterium sp. YY-01]|uniref:LacI family DNA-binding transcriptional regulator n=1 Tax=Microbacterium sp. YY-01 TaxID=3421634 RepID=UPI003D163DDD
MATRVSMAMVAAHVGVSGQTVSRVVHGNPHVDPSTRRRVEQAMAELGYRPHRAARALRTGRSHTVGVVAASLGTVGNFRMVQAVVESAARHGYAVMVVTAADEPSLAAAFDRLHEENVDGVIVLNEASAFVPETPRPTGLRIAVVDAEASPLYSTVSSAHADGARTATAHLLARGHTRVHHIAGPAESFAARERERGWRETLLAAGITPPEVVRAEWSAQSAYDVAAQLGRATAVFCANDYLALGLIRAYAERGMRVPEDVSVVGFDDVPEAANYLPPLTTVRQDFTALAEAAWTALGLPATNDQKKTIEVSRGAHASIATALVQRASTAALTVSA